MCFFHSMKFLNIHGFESEYLSCGFALDPKDLSIGSLVDFGLSQIAIGVEYLVHESSLILHKE